MNFSLLLPIDTKHGVWVAYNKTQLGIVTQVYVIKVKVTVTKNRNSVCFGLLTPNLVYLTNATKITASFFFIAIFHFLFLSHQYLVETLKTWFHRIAALLVLLNEQRFRVSVIYTVHVKHPGLSYNVCVGRSSVLYKLWSTYTI